MRPQVLRHFGFETAPFTKDIDDNQLWLPKSKECLVDGLLEALEARESILLTGEPGAGKTSVLRALRHRMEQKSFRSTYCSNVTLGRRDFYRQLCVVLGLTPRITAAAVFQAVRVNIEELASEKLHPVLFLDEAHLMHQDVLDHLHILMNFDWDRKPLLSVVLIGLPDLRDRLRLRRNRSLYSRIVHRMEVESLSFEDTEEYIKMRLKLVGCDRDLFTAEAIALLHEASHGSLRDLDRLARHGLRRAFRAKKRLIEVHHLEDGLEED